MICLSIDTTGKFCSAALIDGEKILARNAQNIGTGHAEILGPIVQKMLASAHVKPEQINKISVCTGPGSFTGLRVGLSFAKGLALPHGTPVVGVSALEVWARAHDPVAKLSLISAADVRRGQVFYQNFINGAAADAPALLSYEQAETAFAAMPKTGGWVEGSTYVSPEILAWIGMEKSPDTNPALPLYHRPPDAKLPGGKTL